MNADMIRSSVHREDFHVLLLLAQSVLSQAGFGDVRVLGRRAPGQKSEYGGHELDCHFEIGGIPVLAIVKVVKDSVHKRMLAELAATTVSRGAVLGILLATKPTSTAMRQAKEQFGFVNLEVIDGDDFVRLMSTFKVGVRANGELDYAYLEYLREKSPEVISFINALKS